MCLRGGVRGVNSTTCHQRRGRLVSIKTSRLPTKTNKKTNSRLPADLNAPPLWSRITSRFEEKRINECGSHEGSRVKGGEVLWEVRWRCRISANGPIDDRLLVGYRRRWSWTAESLFLVDGVWMEMEKWEAKGVEVDNVIVVGLSKVQVRWG